MSKIQDDNDNLYKNKIISNRALQLKAKEVAKQFSPKLDNLIKVRLDEKTVIFFKQGTSPENIEKKLQKFKNAKSVTEIVYFKD